MDLYSLLAAGQQRSPYGPIVIKNNAILGGAQIAVQNNGSDVGGGVHTVNLVPGNGISVNTSLSTTTLQVELDNTTDFVTLSNQSGGTITAGAVVAITTGGVQLANGSDGTKRGFAICTATVNSAVNGVFQTQGLLTLADWSAGLITGTTLVLGSRYYLSTTNGKMDTTAPSSSGNMIQPVGYAVTTTTLKIVFETSVFVR